MIRKLLCALTIVACVFGTSMVAAFDREPSPLDEFLVPPEVNVNLETSVVEITTFGSALTHYPIWDENLRIWQFKEAVGTFYMNGSGFLVKNGFVITAAHVVEPDGALVQTKSCMFYCDFGPIIKIYNRVIYIGKGTTANIVYSDKEKDIALLKLDGYWPAAVPLRYRMAYTTSNRTISPLKSGDAVAIVVRQRDNEMLQISWMYEVRFGDVKSPYVEIPDGVPIRIMPWFSMNDVTLNLIIYPGDSGSPIFAFEKGEPVLVGIARAYCINRETGEVFFYMARIDTIKQIIEAQ